MSSRFRVSGCLASFRKRLQRQPRKNLQPLKFEWLEPRWLLAATDLGAVEGRVFVDLDINGSFDSGEQLVGAEVQLFADDGTTPGSFDAGDSELTGPPVNSPATTDANGIYRFDGLASGTYFAVQPAQTLGARVLDQQVSGPLNVSGAGTNGTLIIDTFATDQAVVMDADSADGLPVAAFHDVGTAEVIGGERDLAVNLSSGALATGQVSSDILFFGLMGGTGDFSVTYDGDDGATTINIPGLAVDLTDGGMNTHFVVDISAQDAGENATITVQNGATTASETFSLLDEGTNTYCLAFDDFTADPTFFQNVDAITLDITGTEADNDFQVANFGTFQPSVETENFLNDAQADLRLEKSVDDESPNLGQDVTFTITLTNDGPDPATNIDVRDVVPDGFSYVSSSIAGGNSQDDSSPTVAGLLWEVDSLAVDGSIALTFQATVLPDGSPLDYSNSAQVTAADQDDDDSTPNNNDPDEDDQDIAIVIPLQIDLELEKTVSNNAPDINDTVTFTLALFNDGPDAATNIDVRDVVPDGFSYVSNSIAGGDSQDDSSPTGAGLLWEVDSLAPNDTTLLTFQATVLADGTVPDYTNSAQVTAADQTDSDSTPNNNEPLEDDQDLEVVDPVEIDLQLQKSVNNDTPDVNDIVTFTLTLFNDGPDTATNIDVRDVVPGGFSYVSSSISGGNSRDDSSPTGSGLLWEVDSLTPGGTTVLSFQATVLPGGTVPEYINSSEVTAADQVDEDSTPNNNEPDEDDQDVAVVDPVEIDLQLQKSVNDNAPDINDVVTFTLTLFNDGPDTATNIDVRDVVPDGFNYVNSSIAGGSSRDDNSPTGAGLLWEVDSLAPGGTTLLTFQATVLPGATLPDYINSSEVTAADQVDEDSTPNNNDPDEDDQDVAVVDPVEIDLQLQKSVNDDTPDITDVVTFTLTLFNDGPDTATNIDVRDVVPDGFSYVGGSISGGSSRDDSSPTGSGLLWEVNSLAPSGTTLLTFQATVLPDGSVADYTNSTQVTAADQVDEDSTPNNNEPAEDDQDVAVVNPIEIDLQLQKSVNDDTPDINDVVTFTLTLFNDGPDTASNIDVRDVVPDGFSYVGGSISGGNSRDDSSPTGSGLLWEVDSLAQGSTAALSFQATVLSGGSVADYINSAQVTAADQVDEDSTPNNNDPDEDDQDAVAVDPSEIDLQLQKSISDATPDINDIVTFTLALFNDGPDTATNIDVRDVVPDGFNYINTSISGGSSRDDSSPTGSGLLWEVNSLAPGGTATLNFQARVLPNGSVADYTNSAEVTAADQLDEDSTPNNNDPGEDDQDAVVVNPIEIDLQLQKSVNDNTPDINDVVTFTLTLFNDGPDTATNIDVRDVVPAGFSYVNNSISGGNSRNDISPTGSGLLWEVDSVTPSGSTVLTFQATVLPGGSVADYTNSAQVTAADQVDEDSIPNNNDPGEDDQDAVVVDPSEIDLQLQKSVDDETPDINEAVTFTIALSNDGPDTATNIDVRDVVPDGYNYVGGSIAGGDSRDGSSPTGAGLLWEVDSLAPGNNRILTFDATVFVNDADRDYTNSAQVTAADQVDEDSTPNNNDPGEDDQDTAAVVPPRLASISGRVFFDADNDGRFDPGETPIRGVTIELKGPVERMVITGLDGRYRFDNLLPGEYFVEEKQPFPFADGLEELGNDGLGLRNDNDIFFFELGVRDEAEGYNFGESALSVSKTDFFSSTARERDGEVNL